MIVLNQRRKQYEKLRMNKQEKKTNAWQFEPRM